MPSSANTLNYVLRVGAVRFLIKTLIGISADGFQGAALIKTEFEDKVTGPLWPQGSQRGSCSGEEKGGTDRAS